MTQRTFTTAPTTAARFPSASTCVAFPPAARRATSLRSVGTWSPVASPMSTKYKSKDSEIQAWLNCHSSSLIRISRMPRMGTAHTATVGTCPETFIVARATTSPSSPGSLRDSMP